MATNDDMNGGLDTVRHFTSADLILGNHLCVLTSEIVDAQPAWMRRGLQQTASGYGARLNTGRKIHYNGKLYRLYATCYGNSASVWFTVQGQRIYVS